MTWNVVTFEELLEGFILVMLVSLCRWELVMILPVFSKKCWTVIYVPIILHFMFGLRVYLSWREDCVMLSPSISLGLAGWFCWYCKLNNNVILIYCLGLCSIGMRSQLSGWGRRIPCFSIECLKYRMLLQTWRYHIGTISHLKNKIFSSILRFLITNSRVVILCTSSGWWYRIHEIGKLWH